MTTSLTNNVLTFNNGSIKDVRNDLNIAYPPSTHFHLNLNNPKGELYDFI